MTPPDDPWAVLGLSPDADDAAIKARWRALAKQHHPDRNPGDQAAEKRFKEVNAAFAQIGDAAARGRMDRSAAASFEDLEAMFADFGASAGADTRHRLTISFIEAACGTSKSLILSPGRTLEVPISPGTEDGALIRLPGRGKPTVRGGAPGDALVSVQVRPHPFFRREDQTVHVTLPISLPEAILGGRVRVPTIHGPVEVSVPAGASGGKVLRLKGRGIARPGRPPGDQMVTLRIALPHSIDPELKRFFTSWARNHGYDPRQGME